MFASCDRPAIPLRGDGWHLTGPLSSFITHMLDDGSLLTVASVTDNDSGPKSSHDDAVTQSALSAKAS